MAYRRRDDVTYDYKFGYRKTILNTLRLGKNNISHNIRYIYLAIYIL